MVGFLAKNRDHVSSNLIECMKNSEAQFVCELFFAPISDTGSLMRESVCTSRKHLLLWLVIMTSPLCVVVRTFLSAVASRCFSAKRLTCRWRRCGVCRSKPENVCVASASQWRHILRHDFMLYCYVYFVYVCSARTGFEDPMYSNPTRTIASSFKVRNRKKHNLAEMCFLNAFLKSCFRRILSLIWWQNYWTLNLIL